MLAIQPMVINQQTPLTTHIFNLQEQVKTQLQAQTDMQALMQTQMKAQAKMQAIMQQQM